MAFLLADDGAPDVRIAEAGLPDQCPRCGADFDSHCNLREVNLTLTTGDQEWDEAGYECACCGWCTEAAPGVMQ